MKESISRYAAGEHYPEQLYRLMDLGKEIGVQVSEDYYALPHEAYSARRESRDYRKGFAGNLIGQILSSEPSTQGWVHRAEALHIVSVPLLGEADPEELMALLGPALDVLLQRRRETPELHRYCALLLRTVSLTASKLDRYGEAFFWMNKAHAQLTAAPRKRTAILVAEAWQQTYLQECGQLSRNVEAALIEQNRLVTAQNLFGRRPNRILNAREKNSLRVVARAAAESGRRAVSLIEFVRNEEGLPSTADGESRRLSVGSWYITCNIMYMRALLLAGLVELCVGADPSPFLRSVPSLWATVIEQSPEPSGHVNSTLTQENRMDLTRNGLLWAFLHGGDHPYVPSIRAPIKAGVPEYLHSSPDLRLDTIECAHEIAKAKHNAGILDNLAHVDTYRLLVDRSGSGPKGYDAWVTERHTRLGSVIDVNDPSREMRTVGSPTLHYLHTSAFMVRNSQRYNSVLRDCDYD
ncbi:MAG: hypothetical protein V7697_28955 [Rhodococcus erythropolis]